MLSSSTTIPPSAKNTRIINGEISDIFDWPWQVSLREKIIADDCLKENLMDSLERYALQIRLVSHFIQEQI